MRRPIVDAINVSASACDLTHEDRESFLRSTRPFATLSDPPEREFRVLLPPSTRPPDVASFRRIRLGSVRLRTATHDDDPFTGPAVEVPRWRVVGERRDVQSLAPALWPEGISAERQQG
jgi:hypothetical protein